MPVYSVYHGDCLTVMPTLEADSIDAIVTDPPYGLEFMGKDWDNGVPGKHFWQEALRVAKPGAHLLAFGGTRTFHRLVCAIEDAGWQIRDTIGWLYGSGFPKSLNVGKAIDKAAGAERNTACHKRTERENWRFETQDTPSLPPITDEAKQWDGWGTALKPAMELICLARKPLDGTVAANVLKHGTGGLNIDACRISTNGENLAVERDGKALDTRGQGWGFKSVSRDNQGRFPANIIHDGSDEVLAVFPQSDRGKGARIIHAQSSGTGRAKGHDKPYDSLDHGDSGSAARFFYCAKASKQDRDEGCEGIDARNNMRVNAPRANEESKHATQRGNFHPTVKPTALMRYLCRLVTPPDGIILDPFMGSGSTGKAALFEGFNFIGIELDAEYVEIAKARIVNCKNKQMEFRNAGV